MLSNAYFLAKFRFDTAENEPAKNLRARRALAARRAPSSTEPSGSQGAVCVHAGRWRTTRDATPSRTRCQNTVTGLPLLDEPVKVQYAYTPVEYGAMPYEYLPLILV